MTVLAVAHRAGNSLAGLHAANRMGVDVIECDVHAYRGRLEVRHLKTAGPLPFLWDRWELASASSPRLGLGELLDAGARGAVVMLDLKGRRESVGSDVADLLHERSHVDRVLICGRAWRSVDQVTARLPYARPVLSARTRPELGALQRRLATSSAPPYGVSVHAGLLDDRVAAVLRGHVEVLMTWPVNERRTLDRVLSAGANAIISDEADVLRAVLGMRS